MHGLEEVHAEVDGELEMWLTENSREKIEDY